jgi:hypothetical protein
MKGDFDVEVCDVIDQPEHHTVQRRARVAVWRPSCYAQDVLLADQLCVYCLVTKDSDSETLSHA